MKKLLVRIFTTGIFLLLATTVSAQDFCQGNFDYDQNVDGSDAFIFKTDFGRSILGNPCPPDGPAPVPQTGQTVNLWGNDDGFYQCGVKSLDQRFTTNCDRTFTDHLTGLMWPSTYEIYPRYTWIDAMTVIDDYNINEFAGHNDWRMPNINELQSLIDFGQYSPAMPPNLYVEWDGEPVWSATTRSNDWQYKYAVDFFDGTTVLVHYESIHSVLPVRGGHCAEAHPKIECNSAVNCDIGSFSCCCVFGFNDPDNYCHPDHVTDLCKTNGGASNCYPCTSYTRFTDNGNATVTDNQSGLIWLKNANCLGSMSWYGALDVVASVASGQCSLTDGSVAGDWRLATREEWESFICNDFSDPAICNTAGYAPWQEGDPFNNIQLGFHWSTTEVDADYAWGLFLSDGEESFGHKSGSDGFVWPVRDP